MQSQISHPLIAILSLFVGFLLILSKIPLLVFLGCILVLAGVFAPFYEDILFKKKQKPLAQPLSNTRQTENNVSSPSVETIVRNLSANEKNIMAVEAQSTGNDRASRATWYATRELISAITDSIQPSSKQKLAKTKPRLIQMEISGTDLTEEEITQAKTLVEVAFPNTRVEEITSPDSAILAQNTDDEGNFKIRLEIPSGTNTKS